MPSVVPQPAGSIADTGIMSALCGSRPCVENNGIHRVLPQRSALTCHKHPLIWPHPSAKGFVM